MAKAIEVADYIVRTISVDPLKLQKLLFYTQAVSLVKFGEAAFDDPIEAWDYGPVVRSVYDQYRSFSYETIKSDIISPNILNPNVIGSADLVIEYYGKKSGADLIQETHSEDPWINAYKVGQNTLIDIDSIRNYYKSIFSFE